MIPIPVWEEFLWRLREKNLDEKKEVGRPAGAAPRSSRAEQIWRAITSAGSMVTWGRLSLLCGLWLCTPPPSLGAHRYPGGSLVEWEMQIPIHLRFWLWEGSSEAGSKCCAPLGQHTCLCVLGMLAPGRHVSQSREAWLMVRQVVPALHPGFSFCLAQAFSLPSRHSCQRLLSSGLQGTVSNQKNLVQTPGSPSLIMCVWHIVLKPPCLFLQL